ncbi:MAG: NADP-dependent malic enzyme, partial [bacterium]|nr:NADP-dependent malic enzyme [bacterium]
MKVAATHALAKLAREAVPEVVSRAYGGERFSFGREYLIPKPFDRRVLTWEAHAVAEAAMRDGVARRHVDLDAYREELAQRLDASRTFVSLATRKVQAHLPRCVFPEALNEKVLSAAESIVNETIAEVELLGNPVTVRARAKELGVNLDGVRISEPSGLSNLDELVDLYRKSSLGRGCDPRVARDEILADPLLCAIMLLESEHCDAIMAGADISYPQAARKIIQLVGTAEGQPRASGMHLVRLRDRTLFFADTTLNISPDAETLAAIAMAVAEAARGLEVEPVVGMLSFANFGESDHPEARKVAEAVRILRTRAPDLPVIGEIQPDWAINPDEFAGLIPREHALSQPAN